MWKIFHIIRCLPKTLYFNFRVFKFKDAIKLKIIIHPHIKFGQLHKGCINPPNSRIQFGYKGSVHIPRNIYGMISFDKSAKIVFKGKATFGEACVIAVNHGYLEFGNNFVCNKNVNISCSNKIVFDDNVLVGWNVLIRDTDGHKLFKNGILCKNSKPVHIGEHVWLCAYTHILKGVTIRDGSIVAMDSIVTKPFTQSNLLIGGYPAKVIEENYAWEK